MSDALLRGHLSHPTQQQLPNTILPSQAPHSVSLSFSFSPLRAELDPVVVPTVGFAAPIHRKLQGVDVCFYDVGGGARIRGVWPSYFADVHGVIYVVDASEPSRFEESAGELKQALAHPMIVGKPLLM